MKAVNSESDRRPDPVGRIAKWFGAFGAALLALGLFMPAAAGLSTRLFFVGSGLGLLVWAACSMALWRQRGTATMPSTSGERAVSWTASPLSAGGRLGMAAVWLLTSVVGFATTGFRENPLALGFLGVIGVVGIVDTLRKRRTRTELTLTADGVRTLFSAGSAQVAWADILLADATNDGEALRLSRSSTREPAFLPMSAFPITPQDAAMIIMGMRDNPSSRPPSSSD